MNKKLHLEQFPLWTALITPMFDDGKIDFPSLERMARKQAIDECALLVLGSTAEALNLKLEERKQILDFIIGLKLNIPLMVGVGGFLLEETLEWVKYLNTLPIHALLVVTPLYAKPGRFGQTAWFKAILDASKYPCMLYNIPSRTGVALHFDSFNDLVGHPNCWALKDASGSVEDFTRFAQIGGDKVQIFSGDDGLLPQFAPHGAKGLVSVASNIWPKETLLYVKKTLAGALFPQEAEAWERWSDSLFLASNPIPTKVYLVKKKIISSSFLRPPLSARDLPSTEAIELADQQIKVWWTEQN